MVMEELEAKRQVVEAGHELVRLRLIVRTWGNISCRIDADRFAITPSGMAYERLTENEIVTVNCRTLEHEGNLRPSGETGIHAAVYRMHPEVGFVIHTHQDAASALSLAGYDRLQPTEEEAAVFGAPVARADYGLPCSVALCARVSKTLEQTGCTTLFMTRHGVLATGRNRDEAFARAETLERVCGRALKTEPPQKPLMADASALLARVKEALPEYPYVLPCDDDAVRRISEDTRVLKPMLDDFAQLIGTGIVRIDANASAGRIRRAAKGRNAVLVKNYGGFCFAVGGDDAEAARYLLEKECKARLNARAYGGASVLSRRDRTFMRNNFLTNYSKLK